MKKKILPIVLAAAFVLYLSACGAEEQLSENSTEHYSTFEFTHFASAGVEENLEAIILFEQSNSTFTAYQVAYPSCTCRDPQSNFLTVCYVEILNTKSSAREAGIRDITCMENKGVWGDVNPLDTENYSKEYLEEHLTQKLIGCSKDDIDSFQGYGTYVDQLDADAISGATVTSANMQSMLKSLMEYHANKYYQ